MKTNLSIRVGMAILAVITAVNLNPCAVSAEDKQQDPVASMVPSIDIGTEATWSGDVSVSIWSKYLGPCNGIPFSKRPVVQTSATATHRSGVSFTFFHSTGIDGDLNEEGKYDDEIDLGVGYSRNLGKGFGLDLGVTYFDEPGLGTFGGEDIWYVNAELGKSLLGPDGMLTNFPPVSAYIGYCVYIPNPNSGTDGNEIIDLGLRASPSVGRLTVPASVAIAYDTGGFGTAKGYIARARVAMDWKINERWSVTLPSVTTYQPVNRTDIDEQIVFGASINWSL